MSSILGRALAKTPTADGANPITGLAERVDALLESDRAEAAQRRAVERSIEAGREASSVIIPLTAAEFGTIYESLETTVHIPDEMRTEIESYVLHNLETSANPEDETSTERLSITEIHTRAIIMIENHAIFLKTTQFSERQIDGTLLPTDAESREGVESISDIAHRVAGEFEHVSPTMLLRAMAGNHENFGLNNEGEPVNFNEESIRELARRLNQTGERVAADLQTQGLTPGTPEFQQAYQGRMTQIAEESGEIRTLGDLIRLLLRFIYPERYPQDGTQGGPFDSNGRPLETAVPRGNTQGAEIATDHRENINLNSEYYGEALVSEFRALPDNVIQAAETITTPNMWGSGNIREDAPAAISGWKLAVMRNAVNSNRYGQIFSANRPFFANDLAARRALIYLPGEGQPLATVCQAGSGGVSNVNNSHGSPVGSFYFQPGDVVHHGNSHRYRSQATVHGMEPMRADYRTDYAQGSNIDPSSGNANSASRAILMHGATGGTWGCWGIPPQNAEIFARAIQSGGGANGEAFLSTR